METEMNQPVPASPVRNAIEIAVYLLLIGFIVAWCFRIVAPFISFLLWGAIIAIAAYSPFVRLRQALGGRNRLAVLIFALVGLAIIVVPAWMFAGSLIDSAQQFRGNLEAGQFDIPAPSENVREWPLVGDAVYANWSAAAANFEDWLEAHSDQVKTLLERILSQVVGIGLAVVQFVAAMLIAAAMLANDEKARAMMDRLFRRLLGARAEEYLDLTTATIRSVTVGVLGIALIQAVLGGAGMLAAGVPAAGVWALLIMVLAIAQLPPLLVLLPAIVYVFSTQDSMAVAVFFAVWSLLVSFSDAALKPMLLGRGVDAPMLVILLGAIGGMLLSGIIGLFLGAVVLALGYKLFLAWLGDDPQQQSEQA
jgi:predicted PurR-regulated permease PerM